LPHMGTARRRRNSSKRPHRRRIGRDNGCQSTSSATAPNLLGHFAQSLWLHRPTSPATSWMCRFGLGPAVLISLLLWQVARSLGRLPGAPFVSSAPMNVPVNLPFIQAMAIFWGACRRTF
jgi:hypothetical protein